MTGAIYIKSKDPTFDRQVELSATVGSNGLAGTAFMVNTPLVEDQIALRISGAFERSHAEPSYSDFRIFDNYDELTTDISGVLRAKLLITPSEMPDTRALLTYSYSKDRPNDALVGLYSGRGDFNNSPVTYTEYRWTEVHNLGLEITHDISDTLRFTSQTGYQYGINNRRSIDYGTEGVINGITLNRRGPRLRTAVTIRPPFSTLSSARQLFRTKFLQSLTQPERQVLSTCAAYRARYCLRAQCVAEIFQSNHQHHRIGRRRQESNSLIEGTCVIGDRMHQHAANTEDFGGIEQSQTGITHQRPTDTAALIRQVDSQSTKYSDWNRVWHISLQAAWCFRCPHRAGGESIIGNHTISLADHESTRRTAHLIGARSSTQPIIKLWNTGVKLDKLMMLGQGSRGTKGHASSHGALIDIVRFRRSFDGAGASSRARYSA